MLFVVKKIKDKLLSGNIYIYDIGYTWTKYYIITLQFRPKKKGTKEKKSEQNKHLV